MDPLPHQCGMDKTKREELEKAYKKEKNPRVAARMLAVHMVYVREKSVSATAADLMRTDKWVYDWLKRFDAGGLDGLRDLPKSGRPASVPRTTMDRIIGKASQGRCTPKELQELVRTETNARLHITSIRRIMRGYGLTPKIPQKVHINRANKGAVQNWQYRFGKRVSRLEEEGFTIVDVDEAFFVHDTVSGRKYWSPRGERIVVPYTGSHQKIVVYGAIAKDGRQLFRTHERFDASTFIRYLKEMQKRFGKVAAVTDRASPHRAKLVKGLLRENKNIRIIYLPKGSPYLNAVEECWHQGKRILLVSEYYRTFADMCNAIITYYRTVRFKLDIVRYASRNPKLFCKNL